MFEAGVQSMERCERGLQLVGASYDVSINGEILSMEKDVASDVDVFWVCFCDQNV